MTNAKRDSKPKEVRGLRKCTFCWAFCELKEGEETAEVTG
jgi:hypothetical protein